MLDIREWLEQLDLGKYMDLFASNDIDSRVLLELTEGDLKELGISLGHRRILLKAIAALREENSGMLHSLSPGAAHENLSAWERMPRTR